MPKIERRGLGVVSLSLCSLLALTSLSSAQTGYPPNGGGNGLGYCYSDCHGAGDGGQSRSQRVQTTEGGLYEYIVAGPRGQAEAVRRAITEAGGRVIRTNQLVSLDETTQIATFPSAQSRERAAALIAQLAPDSSLALHHLYGFAQARSPRLYAPELIGDGAPGRCRLAGPLTIGMIDGPINTNHPALRGVDVTFETVVLSGPVPDTDHGTAVAVLLVGEDDTGALAGFARGARLHAVSVFSERDQTEEASVERISDAVDRLVGGGVRLINMSFAGPRNEALARVITAAAARGAILVAASGNDHRPLVAWPAAAPEVIAVTAIDAARRRFRLANTGVEVEFAAPGVDIFAARGTGSGYVSGTSFAAPIVTALAARQMTNGAGSVEAVRARLRAGVETLGQGQRNTEFGWGLARSNGC